MPKHSLTQAFLAEIMEYEPATGIFTWKARGAHLFSCERICNSWNAAYAGKPAGSVNSFGYIVTTLCKRPQFMHRLAFLHMTGSMPPYVDHINGNPADNRWCNLRGVSQQENLMNTKVRKDNKSGVVGVAFCPARGKWRSRIKTKTKDRTLGYFDTLEEAAAKRMEASIEHGFHPNHGRARWAT